MFLAALGALGGLTSVLKGALGVANSITNYLEKKQDAQVEKYKVENATVQTIGTEALRVEAAKNEAWGRVAVQAMMHPFWWAAWIMFVIPVGAYDGMIFFVSIFDRWLNTPGCTIPKIGDAVRQGLMICEWWVREIPPAQGQSRANILYFIFGAQATSGVAAGVGQVVSKWLGSRK
jgi:hypothetical protein